MERPARARRAPADLPACLHQRLNNYALLASAAGMAAVALGGPCEAQIVYTPADEVINRSVGQYGLDLNHDGIVDFIIAEHPVGGRESRQSLFVKPDFPQNRIKCGYPSCLSTNIYAAALPRGAIIGNSESPYGWLPAFALMAGEERFGGKASYFDEWANVSNRYLGFQFQISGQTYYGWARLTVKFHPGLPEDRTWEAHLTGYAYQTGADVPIIAGQTQDGAEVEGAQEGATPGAPASLGKLALGANGVALWRRGESDRSGVSATK